MMVTQQAVNAVNTIADTNTDPLLTGKKSRFQAVKCKQHYRWMGVESIE